MKHTTGERTMSVETAQELFVEELKDIYSAEKQAIRAYPRLVKAVTSEELKEAMQQHLEETEKQLERLEQVFEQLEERPGGKTCNGMKGLLEEAFEHKDEIERGPVLDAALIGALQRVEHYEIAAYGTVIAFAEATGQSEIQQLLEQTLEEEKATDQRLTQTSESVNEEAISLSAEDGEEEEGDEEEEEEEEEEDEEEEEPAKPAPKKSAKKSSKK
jgi:ferritin-like metal-binding protein YciE